MTRRGQARLRGQLAYSDPTPVAPEMLADLTRAVAPLGVTVVAALGYCRLHGEPRALDRVAGKLGFDREPGPMLAVSKSQAERLIAQAGVARALQVVSDAAVDAEAPTLSSGEIVRLQDEADDRAETIRRNQ